MTRVVQSFIRLSMLLRVGVVDSDIASIDDEGRVYVWEGGINKLPAGVEARRDYCGHGEISYFISTASHHPSLILYYLLTSYMRSWLVVVDKTRPHHPALSEPSTILVPTSSYVKYQNNETKELDELEAVLSFKLMLEAVLLPCKPQFKKQIFS